MQAAIKTIDIMNIDIKRYNDLLDVQSTSNAIVSKIKMPSVIDNTGIKVGFSENKGINKSINPE